jgi:hypothetical protein
MNTIQEEIQLHAAFKGALTSHHAIKAYWGNRCIAPCVLDLGTRWKLHTAQLENSQRKTASVIDKPHPGQSITSDEV